jgi:Tol biopolymer transport system component
MGAVRGKSRWAVSIVVAAACLLAPAAAQATLAFTRNPLDPVVWVAEDNGSGAHRLVPGSSPRVSPNGKVVALLRQGKGRRARSELVLAPADGSAPPAVLAKGWRETFVFAWSPDSKSVAAVLGPELGPKRLALIDTVTGAQQTIARGYFNGVSFAPQGGQLVYGRAASEDFPPRSDVYRFDIPVPGAVSVAVQGPQRLTHDHRSTDPIWGPSGRIVFARQLGAKKRRYGPKNELFTMSSAGGGVRRLTHTRVGPLLQGLVPTQWSADGSRLLAEFGGQDTSYAVAVNPRTGSQHALTRQREVGFVGAGLSPNGRLVLGSIGGFEPGPGHDVATVPYGGGRPRVLVRNASEPSWSG